MAYRNLNAEIARAGMTKEDLWRALKDLDCNISYQKLCRQLRGEAEISFGQAGLMSKIFGQPVDYLFEREVK